MRHAYARLERRVVLVPGLDDETGLEHHRLAPALADRKQPFRIVVRQLVWCALRKIVVERPKRVPAVDRHGEQDIALRGNRVAAHQVMDRQRRHADADADRNRGDHQASHDRVAAHALQGKFQVVGKHRHSRSRILCCF